jgi:glucose-specific phosphotransferase system IIA component
MKLFKHLGELEIQAPCRGTLVDLSKVPDPVFSSGMMGKGAAILPAEGVMRAVCDGEYSVMAPTGHAYGITTRNKAEILVHIGIDTVQFKGRCFQVHQKAETSAHQGEEVITADLEYIRSHGCSDLVCILLTNSSEFQEVEIRPEGPVSAGDWILRIRR